jgi:hypothetical protein
MTKYNLGLVWNSLLNILYAIFSLFVHIVIIPAWSRVVTIIYFFYVIWGYFTLFTICILALNLYLKSINPSIPSIPEMIQ